MKKNKLVVFVLTMIVVLALGACGEEGGDGADGIVDDNGSADEIVDEDGDDNEDDLRVLEGTIVATLEGELLFVTQLSLSEEMLERTAEEWFESDEMGDIYRLTDNGSDISIGTEIRISFAITTMSIPPLVPEWDYEVI